MTMQTAPSSYAKPGGQVVIGKPVGLGEDDLSVFNLRDTLKAISVRDANFHEFLAALKMYGTSAAK